MMNLTTDSVGNAKTDVMGVVSVLNEVLRSNVGQEVGEELKTSLAGMAVEESFDSDGGRYDIEIDGETYSACETVFCGIYFIVVFKDEEESTSYQVFELIEI